MSYSQILRIRPFRNLWLGQAISQFGDAFYYVVFLFMVKRITGSSAMVGYVGALEALPYLLFSPYAGVLADRMDRRRIMLASDLISGAILALFALSLLVWPKPETWVLLTVPCILSIVRCFFMPAKSAAIPSLVPTENLLTANALSMTTQSLMPLLGLGMSASVLGALYAISEKWFFTTAVTVNLISFFLSAYFIFQLPQVIPDRKDVAEKHPMQDFRDGISFVRRRKDLTVLLVCLTIFRLMVAPFFVTYVVANERWFDGRPQTLSWFEFSFFALMAVFSVVVGKLKIQRPTITFMIGLGGIGVLVAAMAFARNFWVFLGLQALCGICVPFADIPIGTYMQSSVPDAFRGRVNALLSMIATGIMPIGMAAAGLIVETVGLPNTFLIMGGGMLAGTMLGFLSPDFRNARSEPRPDPGLANGELATT